MKPMQWFRGAFGLFRHKHNWRRAHKNEDASFSYCRTCDATRAVKRRQPKEAM
jgi:hypothetical protein